MTLIQNSSSHLSFDALQSYVTVYDGLFEIRMEYQTNSIQLSTLIRIFEKG